MAAEVLGDYGAGPNHAPPLAICDSGLLRAMLHDCLLVQSTIARHAILFWSTQLLPSMWHVRYNTVTVRPISVLY